jgi:uncharacterized cupredoxin-like copper-binding protein
MGNRTIACAVLALLGFGASAHGPEAGVHESRMNEAASEIGSPVTMTSSMRVVEIDMDDRMRYSPPNLRVWAGEPVRIVATNRGKVMHEIVFGTRTELEAHARHMRDHPDMHHEGGSALHVPPGETREMGWRFTRRGVFLFGCLVPGHFEAGMVGHVVVEDR